MTNEKNDLVQRVKDDSLIDIEHRLVNPKALIPLAGSFYGLLGAHVLYQSTEPRDLMIGAASGFLLGGAYLFAERMYQKKRKEK